MNKTFDIRVQLRCQESLVADGDWDVENGEVALRGWVHEKVVRLAWSQLFRGYHYKISVLISKFSVVCDSSQKLFFQLRLIFEMSAESL